MAEPDDMTQEEIELPLATPCANSECGHRWDDHDDDGEIIGGQCFECPCNQFVFGATPSEDTTR